MPTSLLVKFWAADICDDRTSTWRDVCVLVSEVLHIGLVWHSGCELRYVCVFSHIPKLPPMHSGFLCTSCLQQLSSVHFTSSNSSIKFHNGNMIDTMAAELASVKLLFKVNIQTSELLSCSLFIWAGIFCLCFTSASCFQSYFHSFEKCKYICGFMKECGKWPVKIWGLQTVAPAWLSEVPSQYKDRFFFFLRQMWKGVNSAPVYRQGKVCN